MRGKAAFVATPFAAPTAPVRYAGSVTVVAAHYGLLTTALGALDAYGAASAPAPLRRTRMAGRSAPPTAAASRHC